MTPDNIFSPLAAAVAAGSRKGWHGFLWMLKILVPISLGTALLVYSGVLHQLDFVLKPLMGVLGLPAMAALPLVVGLLTGIYGGIATMTVLPFTSAQMTLIAIFLLISHNIIQEAIIQGKSGLHPLKATAFRLVVSCLTVVLVSRLVGGDAVVIGPQAQAVAASASFGEMIAAWCRETALLTVKIFLIIMPLMILLEAMKRFHLIQYLVKLMGPLLTVMGVDRRVGLLWLTAAIFGLSYGAAVIVEEAREGQFSPEELSRLQLSIGVNHSMIEDPALFLPLGLSPFWLWVPRLVAAILVVHLYNLWRYFLRHRLKAAAAAMGSQPVSK
jgi:Fe2+ transport system protein B